MKFQTLALTTVIGLSAVTVGMAQDAATRSLLLRGTNTVTANVGTLTVPALTLPRTYTLQNQSGTVSLQTPAVLGTNRVILSDATGKLDNAAAMTDGQLLVGSTGAAPAPATPTGTRGLAITLGAGSIDFALPTGALDAHLRYNGANWVSTGASFTSDATGNTAAQGDLTLGAPLSATGGSLILNDNAAGTSFNGTIQAPSFTANRTIDIPDASGTILLSTGGTANQLTRWGAGGTSLVDASLSDDGAGTLARAGSINLNPGALNTLATNGSFTVSGTTTLGDADADATTIRGTINLNTTNAAGATVNINTSAQGNTTNVGSSTAGNVTNLTGNSGGAAVTIVNANGAGGTGLAITDAFTNGLTIGTGTAPQTGIRVTSNTNGIIVNSGGGGDLTINEDGLYRTGSYGLNVGVGNFVTTNGSLQVDGPARFGTDAAVPAQGQLVLNDNTAANVFTGTLQTVAALTAARTYTLPDASGTVLLSSGGTANQLTRFGAGGSSVVDGSLSDDGAGTLARAGNIAINTGAANTLSTNGNASIDGDLTLGTTAVAGGSITWNDNTAGASFSGVMSGPTLYTAARTYTLPDASGTFLLSTGGTANQMTRWGAGGTSLVDGSLSDNGTGTLSATATLAITTTGIQSSLAQTGDVNGTTTFTVLNRNHNSGVRVTTTGVDDVAEIGFAPPTSVQSNLRYEGRNASKQDAAQNTEGEFQVRMNSLGVATYPFYAGNGVVGTTVNTTLGNAITDLVTINGTVRGSENRVLAAAATNRFAGRVQITFAADGAGPAFTINNTQVTANSVIIVTVQSNTAVNYTAVVSAITAGASFNVRIAGGLIAGDDLYINYMIINP